jgi:HlyD family secretion protein
MSATVEIQTETALNVLTVPIQAVTTRMAQDSLDKIKEKGKEKTDNQGQEVEMVASQQKSEKIQECIFLFVDGKAVKRDVKTGIQDNTYIEILTGLKGDEEIITAPYSAVSKTLKDGDPVKKVDKKDLFTAKK